MAMPNMSAQTAALTQGVQQLGSAARSTGADMQDLSDKLFTYGKAIFTFGAMEVLKSAFSWTVKTLGEQRQQLKLVRERSKGDKESLDQAKQRLAFLEAATIRDQASIDNQKKIVKEMQKAVTATNQEKKFREELNKVLERPALKANLVILTATTAAWMEALSTSHKYNQSLMQANTDLKKRFELVEKLALVQAETGLSTESTGDAAHALVEYGQDLTSSFQDNVKLVGMMRDGLGVSAQTGAEMVVIFTRQLRTGAESVANVISQIAAETGLAAEKAAQFAIEIGKSLRLLGPGFRTEAAGVTKVITQLAGHIQELGGNAQSVINMFRRMSGGSSEAFFLRGLAGVRPGQLGTAGGANEAMKGLDARIKSILTAPEGTEMFVAQLEAVAEMSGMSANEVIDFKEAMKEMNKPLSESATLAKAYRDQTAALGKSWDQMREAFRGMITAALMPMVQLAAEAAAGLADLVKMFTQSQGLIWIFRIGIPVAGVLAIGTLLSLGKTIVMLAYKSKFAQAMMSENMPALFKFQNGLAGTLKFFKADWARTGLLVGRGAGLASGGGGLSGMSGLGLAAPILAVAAAGVLGYALGSVLEKTNLPIVSWLKKQAYYLGAMKDIAIQERDKNLTAAATGRVGRNSAIHASQKAAQALADYTLNPNAQTKAAYDKAMFSAVGHGRLENQSEASIRSYVNTWAKTDLDSQIYTESVKRGTVKTDADKAKDQSYRDALRILGEQQAENTKKGAAASVAAAAALQKQFEALATDRNNQFFHMTDLNSASNRISYTPNANMP